MTLLKVFIGFVFLVAAEVNAATRYLDGNITPTSCTTYSIAKRNCSGTDGTAYKTLTEALTAGFPAAGDTLLIRAGTYGSTSRVLQSGTSWTNAPTFQRYQSETVTFTAFPSWGYNFHYITIDGVIFDGGEVAIGMSYDVPQAQKPGPIWFKNVELKNSQTHGFQVNENGANGNIWENCKVHDVGTIGYHHGFYITTSDNRIENCEIYNIAGSGIKFGESSVPQSGNIARNNIIHDFSRNTSAADGGGSGIQLANNGHNSQILNNTIYACTPGCQVWYYSSGINSTGNSGAKIYKNMIVAGSNVKGIYLDSFTSNAIVEGNIVYQHLVNITDETRKNTFNNNFCNVAGTGCAIVGNLTFMNPAAGDFRIQSGNPAITAGVGANQYSSSSSSRPSAPLNLNATVIK